MNTQQRDYDDFHGLLSDVRGVPSVGEKQRLFSALSYQDTPDIQEGLQKIAEISQKDISEIHSDYSDYLLKVEQNPAKANQKEISHGPKTASGFESRSDSGNSKRMVKKFGDKLRFCHSMNCWLIWTGDHWRIDEDGAIFQYARSAVADIYLEAASISDRTERRDHVAFALRSESERALKAMVGLARSEPGIPIRRETLDFPPFMLNVLNGILNLETGEIIDHDPNYFFTKILPFEFDIGAEAPLWEKFLDEVTGGNDELKKYLQQVVGYCLTASTREQCFFIFWGGGLNGKSTFVKIMLELLGPWAAQTGAETFLIKRGGGFNDLARLADKRVVAAIETDEGGRLAEGLVKSLSGCDRIVARHHYQEFFEYVPPFKIILTTNHKPQIRGNDFAIWRRVRLVPFTWQIPEAKVDPDLFDKLKSELPGILAWALKGCFAWQNLGKLETPEIVKSAVQEYQQEQDQVSRFISDCCETGTDADSESAKTLYGAYQKWTQQNGEHYFSATRFGRRLQELGFKKSHGMTGNIYLGIHLIFEVSHE